MLKHKSFSIEDSINNTVQLMSELPFRYPYEAIRVVTSDGYVLLLERIPRLASKFSFLIGVCVSCMILI